MNEYAYEIYKLKQKNKDQNAEMLKVVQKRRAWKSKKEKEKERKQTDRGGEMEEERKGERVGEKAHDKNTKLRKASKEKSKQGMISITILLRK